MTGSYLGWPFIDEPRGHFMQCSSSVTYSDSLHSLEEQRWRRTDVADITEKSPGMGPSDAGESSGLVECGGGVMLGYLADDSGLVPAERRLRPDLAHAKRHPRHVDHPIRRDER